MDIKGPGTFGKISVGLALNAKSGWGTDPRGGIILVYHSFNMMTHEEISKKAREIWEREGRPIGRDIEHWLQAELEMRQAPDGDQAHQNLTSQDAAMLHVPAALAREDSGRKRSARRSR